MTVTAKRDPTRVYRAARAVEPELKRIFYDAVKHARSTARTKLHELAVDWSAMERVLQQALGPIRDAGRLAADAEVRLSPWAEHAVAKQSVFLDLMNPWAIRWANEHAAELVRRVPAESRRAIRAVIVRAQVEGLSVREQAALIEDILHAITGLTSRQAVALYKYRANLLDRGLSDERVQQLVDQQAGRYLAQRAETIARHESLAAANAGQDAIWREAIEQGLLDAGQLTRWITAGGDRVCPICRPMNGLVVPLGAPFISTYDGTSVTRPPAHVFCRCQRVLVIE